MLHVNRALQVHLSVERMLRLLTIQSDSPGFSQPRSLGLIIRYEIRPERRFEACRMQSLSCCRPARMYEVCVLWKKTSVMPDSSPWMAGRTRNRLLDTSIVFRAAYEQELIRPSKDRYGQRSGMNRANMQGWQIRAAGSC